MSDDFISTSYQMIHDHAAMSAAGHLGKAKVEIDKVFGEGYAAKNPELVVAFMQAATKDESNASLAKTYGLAVEKLRETAEDLFSNK